MTRPPVSRRRLLEAGAAGLGAGLAGCIGRELERGLAGDDGQSGEGGDALDAEQTGSLQATVEVAPDGRAAFEPASVSIDNGDSVRWIWRDEGYALEPESVPPGATWEGVTEVQPEGFTYEHQFTVTGEYRYRGYALEDDAEMFGTVVVRG